MDILKFKLIIENELNIIKNTLSVNIILNISGDYLKNVYIISLS